ncbi:acyclic terpene utilization AtuA family protein [Thermopolyspora sp. NPDC052614]|uniref:acyclic terpene utilization AtuA family protein n=1 Tax=Thermopolyspora sp. NPDC052614 TaxID=3155682 RepID=UPI003432B872
MTTSGSGSVRIGNCSGFYGDRLAAMEEILQAGVDVITGDYLAELTMLILARQKAKDPEMGYASTFLTQLSGCLRAAHERGVRVVANAGGMNPRALAERIREFARAQDLDVPVAYVDGDDLTAEADALGLGKPLAANAYLGAFGIVRALEAGAEVVVTGRVTDASLTVGPAAWFHGWSRTDHDAIAGAMAAGHIIECGAQATGGNFSFFTEIADLAYPGFPIARIAADGSSVITKPDGSGGAVTAETVLSQLLYEVAGARYPGPDATLRLDSIVLTQEARDRVRVSGVRGEPPPPDLKVSVVEIGGFLNEMTFLLTGLDIEAKAELVRAQFDRALSVRPARIDWELARTDHPDADVQEEATARLTVLARDPDPKKVGRAFSNAAVETALTGYPGLFLAAPPGEGRVYGRYRPAFVPQTVPAHTVHLPDGTAEIIPAPAETRALAPTKLDETHDPADPAGPADPADAATTEAAAPRPTDVRASADADTVRVPLGRFAGARSGDKGGAANIGVWARTDVAWAWLREHLTADALRILLPETAGLRIDRVELPRLRAVNFVVHDILGEGVAYRARFDAQAKGLGEWLRSRVVEVPAEVAAATALDDHFAPTTPNPEPRP